MPWRDYPEHDEGGRPLHQGSGLEWRAVTRPEHTGRAPRDGRVWTGGRHSAHDLPNDTETPKLRARDFHVQARQSRFGSITAIRRSR